MTDSSHRSRKNGFVDFKAVKAAVNIVQVLERYGLMEKLKRTHDRLSGVCPIHQGTNPTQFRVSVSKNCFNCFGDCGRGGNVIDFVSLMEDVPFREAALLLQEWFLPEEPAAPVAKNGGRKSRKQRSTVQAVANSVRESSPDDTDSDLESDENPPLSFELTTLKRKHPYLDERGISSEMIDLFGLGFCSRGCMKGRIAIPIHNPDGELVAYAGRWPGDPPDESPKYKFPKGFKKSLEVFNFHRAAHEPADLPLVIVEGFFDCIALREAGIYKCVALMGTSLSAPQADLIAGIVSDHGEIEILFDADEAGRHGAEVVSRELSNHARVRVVDLPEEGMQPDHLTPEELAVIFE